MSVVVIMDAGLELEVCESDAEVGGSEVKICMSNAEVVLDTELFSPLRVGVSTLSGSVLVVDVSSSFSSSCFAETSVSAGKDELDVVSPDLVITVL